MKLSRCSRVALAGLALLLGLSLFTRVSHAQTPTYKAVSLDAGGWVSGFAQHPSGRLYGYGDTFGVYRSDDFGANWRFLQNSLTENATTVYGLDVSTTDANRVAFLGATGLWNSTDGGETWAKRLDDITAATWDPEFWRTRGAKPLAYHPSQPDELWMAATRRDKPGSLWRSIDNGQTWSGVGGTTFVKEQVTTIHFFPTAPNEVWVGTAPYADRRQMGGLWCSVDSGATWRKVWDNNGQRGRMGAPPLVSSIARNSDRVSVIATNMGVWQITATNWNDLQTYVATQRAFADQKIPNVTTLADGTFWASEIGDTPSAPKVSADGITWTDRPISLSSNSVPEWLTSAQITPNRIHGRDMLVQDVKNPARWLLTGSGSAHLSEDNGQTWRYQPGGMAGLRGFRVDFDRTQPGRAYLSTYNRGIFVINDGGLTGKSVQSSHHSFGELHTFHETMVSADGQMLIAAGVRYDTNRTVLIRSTDGGATWTKITTRGLAESVEGITHAVMSLDDPQDFLVVNGAPVQHGWGYHDMGPGGGAPNSPGLYRTTDGGANFVPVGGASFEGLDTGMGTRPEYLYLERDGINPDVRYLALRAPNKPTARGVWRSDDGGTTWTPRSNPFPGQWDSIAAFSVDPTVEGRLWAGGSRLRRSDDGGDSWSDVADFTSVTSVSSHGGRVAVLGRRGEEAFNRLYASADNGVTWQEMTSSANRLGWGQNVTVDPWRAGQIWVGGPRSFEIINPPTTLPPLLATTPKTGFDRTDLGTVRTARVTMIRFAARAGSEIRMIGGRFEGSRDGKTWTTLATINLAPSVGLQTLAIGNSEFFRYLRYTHPNGTAGVGKVEFRGQTATAPLPSRQGLPEAAGLVGQSLAYRIPVSGYPAPTFTIAQGTLPAGLKLNASSGVISGKPTGVADSKVTVRATNFKGSANTLLKFAITFGPRLSVTPSLTHFQLANTTGTVPITLTNTGNAPLSWAAKIPDEASWITAVTPATGTLAAGASVSMQAAVDTNGIADAQARTANFIFTSNDPTSPNRTIALNLKVGTPPLPPVIEAGQAARASRGGILSHALKASNNPDRWALVSGSLPQGVALDALSGIVSGTPMVTGVFRAEFTAANGGGASTPQSFTLTVVPAAPGTNYDFNVSQAHFEETFTRNGGWPWGRTVGVGESGGLAT
ncbi:MAG TPA: putative Ig domain-containing protein, partial [Abditibacteriaceae bacterium]